MHSHVIEKEVEKLVLNKEMAKEVILTLYEHCPEEAKKAIHYATLENHLDEEMMNEALTTITRYDNVKAPFWTFAEFTKLCSTRNISVVNEKYNLYDLNFLTQYYFADFKSLGKEPEKFIDMAIDKLHDVDDPKACETAYWEAKHRLYSKH